MSKLIEKVLKKEARVSDASQVRTRFIGKLKGAINTEQTMGFCYMHLASLIKNGRIKNTLSSYSDVARHNESLLVERLQREGDTTFVSQHHCDPCQANVESFSVSGAINLGLEITDIAIKFYKDLLELSKPEDRKLFKELWKEKCSQKEFLKKEKKFGHKDVMNFTQNYCIPEVISKLWK